MFWIFRSDKNKFSNKKQYTFVDNENKYYSFSRHGALGQVVQMDTPIYFTHKEWQEAIDRGLGTHATSIVTRTRAQLGAYISRIEEQFDNITEAPPPQRLKCNRIREAQALLRMLEQKEREVDPANLQNGPLQEEQFKALIQSILFDLRGDLVAIDYDAHSAKLGQADLIISNIIEEINHFNWPMAPKHPSDFEKITKRTKITQTDQLTLPQGGIYYAQYEFPDGLSSTTRDRLINVLFQKNLSWKSLKHTNNNLGHFKSIISELGETRPLTTKILQFLLTPVAFIVSPIIALANRFFSFIDRLPYNQQSENLRFWLKCINWIRESPVGISFNTFLNEPYQMLPSFFSTNNKERILEKYDFTLENPSHYLISYIHAKRIANTMTLEKEPFDKEIKQAIVQLNSKHPFNINPINPQSLERKIVWELCKKYNQHISLLSPESLKYINKTLAPVFSIEQLNHFNAPYIFPKNIQGNTFSRLGITGALHSLLEPIMSTFSTLGRNDPIIGSTSTFLWLLSALYLGGLTALRLAPALEKSAWFQVLETLGKLPGVSTTVLNFLGGPMQYDTFGALQGMISELTQDNKSFELQMENFLSIQSTVKKSALDLKKLINKTTAPDYSELDELLTLLKNNNPLTYRETQILLRLLPKANSTTIQEDRVESFLKQKYPNIINVFGLEQKDSQSNDIWHFFMMLTLQNCYSRDIQMLRFSNPEIWELLKQFPKLIQQLTHHSVHDLEKYPMIQPKMSFWRKSIITTPFRAIHGLIGGVIIGIPTKLYYFVTKQPYPVRLSQICGYNNLLGILEGLPFLVSDLTIRLPRIIHEMYLHGRARLYDTALAIPQNKRSIPGFIGALLLSIPILGIDALFAIPSLLWNGIQCLFAYFFNIPTNVTKKDFLYAIPIIGFMLEALRETSFEKRAIARIINNNEKYHEAIGIARTLFTARSEDIPSYRHSYFQVGLTTKIIHPTPQQNIAILDLKKAHQTYAQQKRFFSTQSYIMNRIKSFTAQHQNEKTVNEGRLLKHIFTVETEMLSKQYHLKHARAYANPLNIPKLNQQLESILYSQLKLLLKQELRAMKNSLTYDTLIGNEKTNDSMIKLFKSLKINTHISKQPIQPEVFFDSFTPLFSSENKNSFTKSATLPVNASPPLF